MMRASMTSISVRSRRLRSDSQQQQKGGDDMLHFGDIYYADLSQIPYGLHIQSGKRPVIVISNDACNYFSKAITIVPLTSQLKKLNMPTHVMIEGNGLELPSMAFCEQIMTIDKQDRQQQNIKPNTYSAYGADKFSRVSDSDSGKLFR